MEVLLQILGRLSSSFAPVPSISPYAGSNDLLPLHPQGPQPLILHEEIGEGSGAPPVPSCSDLPGGMSGHLHQAAEHRGSIGSPALSSRIPLTR